MRSCMWLHPPCCKPEQGLKRARTPSAEVTPDATELARSVVKDDDICSESSEPRTSKRNTSDRRLDTLEWRSSGEPGPDEQHQGISNGKELANDAFSLGAGMQHRSGPTGCALPSSSGVPASPSHSADHHTPCPVLRHPSSEPVLQQQRHVSPCDEQGASLVPPGRQVGSRPEGVPQSSTPNIGSVGRQQNRSTSSSDTAVSAAVAVAAAGNAGHVCPPHGVKAIMGRRSKMEDAFKAVPFLLEVPLAERDQAESKAPPRVAVNLQTAPALASDPVAGPTRHLGSGADPIPEDSSYVETFHFFGVFDGHGGDAAALYCSSTLHQHIAEALSGAPSPSSSDSAPNPPGADVEIGTQPQPAPTANGVLQAKSDGATARTAMATSPRSDASGDEQFVDADSDGDATASGVTTCSAEEDEEAGGVDAAVAAVEAVIVDDARGGVYSARMIETAIAEAFCRTDNLFGESENAALVGTTAVVALVGSRVLYVANCGDSRAVLCRKGVAYPLTDDHKAAREDETARIEAAGGQILFWNGVRVMGVLAVSRAIGDHCLRPFVVAEPEVTILERRKDDELLLLASDGLWDVLSNQEAASLAMRCVQRARARGATREGAARIAATVLTRAAVDRGSRDNVTVVVVDLADGGDDDGQQAAAAAAAAAAAGGADGVAGGEAGAAAVVGGKESGSSRGGGGGGGGGGGEACAGGPPLQAAMPN